ncbi:MAG: hypothetical protein GY820_20685 [Gammaproteobacteria bacterium]|nr:hypothetical protein [Gammaproteobacteria bacterium]
MEPPIFGSNRFRNSKSNRTSSFTSDSRRIGIASSFPTYDDRKGWKGSLWIEKLLV